MLAGAFSVQAMEPHNNAARAPRDDLSSLLASCNSAAGDLAAIGQELCAIQREMDFCASIPLFQSDMPATLSVDDQVYCLAEEVTGNITINGIDVTLDLNDHTINGRVIVNGERAIIRNGTIMGSDPADDALADSGVLLVNGDNAEILNVFVGSIDSTLAGVNGNTAVVINGANVVLQASTIQAGNAGAINGVGLGGTGLLIAGDRTRVQDSQVYGGAGSDSNNGLITVGGGGSGFFIQSSVDGAELLSSVFYAGDAGAMSVTNDINNVVLGVAGGNSIQDSNVTIWNCMIYGGNANAIVTTGNVGSAVGAVVTMDSPAGLTIAGTSSTVLIKNSEIRGSATASLSLDAMGIFFPFTQGQGGAGIVADGQLTINNCKIAAGPAGSITAIGGIGAGAIVDFGAGGAGLEVTALNSKSVVTSSQIIGGNTSSISGLGVGTAGDVNLSTGGDGIVSSGLLLLVSDSLIEGGDSSPVSAGAAGIGSAVNQLNISYGGQGVLLTDVSKVSQLERCTIYGGDLGAISAVGSINNIPTTLFYGPRGGAGISVKSQSTDDLFAQAIINACNVIGGAGADVTSTGGSVAGVASVAAGNAGNGIDLFLYTGWITTLLPNSTLVENSTVSTARGGDVLGAVGGLARQGGNGGDGITISLGLGDSTGTRVTNNYVGPTGRGGVAAGIGGTDGGGGCGIRADLALHNFEISKNTIAYTGTGNALALGGAIYSSTPSAGVIIYGNYAHNIAASPEYILVAGAVDGQNGTAFALAAGTNNLFNIFKP